MKSISLLGTGLLGAAVVRRLLARGFRVTVWNRTPAKARELEPAGAGLAGTAADAIAASEVVVLFLADAAAIRETLLSRDSLQALTGRTVVQMGTISPEESIALAGEIRSAGADYLEAPVLGSIPQALDGSLFVLVGGTESQLDRCRALFEAIGRPPLHIGPIPKAAAVKLALNHLIGTLTASFAASLALVEKSGADPELFMQVLRASALYAPTFDKKLDRMLSGDFSNPTFPVRHLKKDMDLFVAAAGSAGIDTGLAAEVSRILCATMEKGAALDDYAALSRTVRGD